MVSVECGKRNHDLPLVMITGTNLSLFDMNWLEQINLDWRAIHLVMMNLDQLLLKHEDIFRKELDTLKKMHAYLEVEPEDQQHFFKPRSVTYTVRSAIEHDLDRLERLRIVENVSYSDWVE